MKGRAFYSMSLLVVWLSALVFTPAAFATQVELEEIAKAIKEKNSRWSAKDTSVSRGAPEERKKRLGSKYPPLSFAETRTAHSSTQLPARLDWRNYNGGSYVSPVKDQGSCNACWAFAVTAALESKVLISQNTPGIPLDLSEQMLTSCGGAGDCDAGYINTASDYIANYGLPPEACYPYTASNGLCSNRCPDWESDSYRIPGWSLVDGGIEAVKQALYHYGPLVGLMAAHTDFFYYNSGIYQHAWGDFEGYHAALIVGYDEDDQYFIVKSSWGVDWGESGYFRIGYDEFNSASQFGHRTIAYNAAISELFPTLDEMPRDAMVADHADVSSDPRNSSPNGFGNQPDDLDRGKSDDAAKPEANKNDRDQVNPVSAAALTGRVRDESGHAIRSAEIKAGKLSATSDDKGDYLIPSIPSGDYIVTAGKDGYVIDVASLSIPPNATVTRDFVLAAILPGGPNHPQKGTPKTYLGPGWFMDRRGTHVTHQEAEAHFAAKERERFASTSGDMPMASAGAYITSDIQELARGLRNDPKLIYDYVHNHIDYIPYFGSRKGATLTYLDGSGNDFDQASLMIALLRASGYTAQYVYGKMSIPVASLANWLGVDQDLSAIGGALGNVNIPYDYIGNDTMEMTRVWVRATIGGAAYLFDPAFKAYSEAGKIDIGQAIGYNRSELIASAGGILAGDYIQNINDTGLRNKLASYASNLVTTVRNQYSDKNFADIIGSRSIVKSNLMQYQSSLPFAVSATTTWNEIPVSYMLQLWIRVCNSLTTVNECEYPDMILRYYVPDLGSNSITLTFSDLTNNQRRPQIRVNGSVIYSGAARTDGSRFYMVVRVDHPSVYDYADQRVPISLQVGPNAYALVTNFGGISDKLLQKRQEQLAKFKVQGLGDSSPEVRGEVLNIMGLLTWYQQNAVEKTIGALMDLRFVPHHRFLMMAQDTEYSMDAGGGAGSIISRHPRTQSQYESEVHMAIRSAIVMGSGWEHGVLEQTMGSNRPAISTIKLFQVANSLGKKIYSATPTNYSVIRPQLVNYSANDFTYIDSKIATGCTFFLPEDGAIPYGQRNFMGYVILDHAGIGMLLGGKYGGESSCSLCVVSSDELTSEREAQKEETDYYSTAQDPVNMSNGAFLYSGNDLNLGGGLPANLAYTRFYDSSRYLEKGSHGYGWTHNYDIRLKRNSHGGPGLGARQPVDAAAFLVVQYVNLDLFNNADSVDAWVLASLAAKWAVDQVIDNSIAVFRGGRKMEYIRLADGSYSPPPGVTTQLVKNGDNTFSLLERFGTRINFNSDNRISELIDVDGNVMRFTYSGDNLASVWDAFGRTFTFNYSGDKISSINDFTGRSVSYSYDADNLVGFTDPEGKTWNYGYDGNHRMTSLKNPLDITSVTNIYDSQGMVKSQTVPRQGGGSATYNFYFSGYRNQEVDPDGHAITYYYDERGREYAQENPLGHRTAREFDGQDRIIKITDPRSNSTRYSFDKWHNLTSIVNDQGHTTTNGYDSLFRLTNMNSPLTNNTQFTYDGNHHPIGTRDAVGNSTWATYLGNGLKGSVTDGRGTVTTQSYDGNGNPLTSAVTGRPAVNYVYDSVGRLTRLTDQAGSSTGFVYDNRNLPTSRTDPLGRTYSFVYDAGRRLIRKTDRNHNPTLYYYTPTGKLDTIVYTDASIVHFTYNHLDNLTSIEEPIGTTSVNQYDAANRLLSMTDLQGFTVSYDYDAAGNLTRINYPGGKTVDYQYDNLNRLWKVLFNGLTATYNYDATTGRLISLTQFNGTTVEYGYDAAYRLTSLVNKDSAAVIAGYQFALDGNGNRTQIIQNEPLAPVMTAKEVSYTYNAQKNRLLSDGTNSFNYDNEGQLESGYGALYSFDYEHRLIGDFSVQFVYDVQGNRLQVTRNGVVTRYIYDAAGNLLAEADGSNNITRYYIYGQGLLAMATPANQIYCYHYNAIGSTVAVTDSSRAVVNKYAYDPFGNVTGQVEATGLAQPFKYVGQYGVMAESNGFYYMRARYYDPKAGRFISEDPIGFEGGDVNLYGYVQNNPVNLIDPWGLDWLYSQSTGQLSYRDNQTGVVTPIGIGYSGHGEGLNNPAMQNVPYIGPIPQGTYNIGNQYKHKKLGPVTMNLDPVVGTETFGRNAFRIHGDNSRSNQSASEGCIVISRDIRIQISGSDDTTLRVKP